MNKLRAFVLGGSAFLLVSAAWASLTYGADGTTAGLYLRVLLVAALLPAVPKALSHLKLWLRRIAQYRENRGGYSSERGSIFVSETPISDPEATLDALVDAVESAPGYDGVSRDAFSEGEGLTVTHTGFHNTFVRVAGDGRLVVTGASEKAHDLARLAERTCSVALARSRTHPFLKPDPVRGAPRAFLSLFLVVLLLFGVGGVTAAGYPGDTFNPSERVVLVSHDARADVDPGYTDTDAKFDKAAFLVAALDEEAVEIGWENNESAGLEAHARQSLRLSETVRTLLSSARDDGLTAEQAERSARIERDLHGAERRVAEAITERLERGRVEGDRADLRDLRDRLLSASRRSV
ncbi:hypothetical protein [Halegenticoccus soli]|uniref:hypothetical protein n=1 Tax=Halegenticoccus soli TaxID=1985678 RepID=UPI000C6EC3EC|nr:hypothetical protein [Halegenticoccus soli]